MPIFQDNMGPQVLCKMLSKVVNYVQKQVKAVRKGGTTSCLCITSLLCLIPLVTVALIFKFHMPDPEYYIIYIDTQDEALFTVNERYLSLGLDSTVITDGFHNFNMTDPKVIKMISYLSPAYLRVGGNQADQIIFSRDGNLNITNDENRNGSDAYTLLASDWLKLHTLAQKAGVSVIYDLNSLLRYENGSWNSENAQDMIRYSQEKGLNLDWELGNEPNLYPHKFNTFVNATQLGVDYNSLRTILNQYSLYGNSLLVGPSTTRLRSEVVEEYFLDFLEAGSEAVSAITFHQYYFSGENATWEEFLDPTNFDYLEYCIDTVKSVLGLLPSVDKPVWLGETSTAWHSGAPNLSDRFIGSFLWIDKLGLSAKMGISVVVRQSIFKGNYALLNDSYYPNPTYYTGLYPIHYDLKDWWLSVLYKKLVGPKVITTETEGDAKIRLYAHCARENPLWDTGSAVVVFGVNLHSDTGYVKIEELSSNNRVYAYEFTSNATLFSQFVRLNGETLKLGKDMSLPDFKPKIIEKATTMTMPLQSIVFWVFTGTNVEACNLQSADSFS